MRPSRRFEDFWPQYVEQHLSPATRAWHFGSITAAILLAVALSPGGLVEWLIAAPAAGALIGYGGAFYGHYLDKVSRPTVFVHPWWSVRAGLRMYFLMWRGQMTAEADRLFGPAASGPQAQGSGSPGLAVSETSARAL